MDPVSLLYNAWPIRCFRCECASRRRNTKVACILPSLPWNGLKCYRRSSMEPSASYRRVADQDEDEYATASQHNDKHSDSTLDDRMGRVRSVDARDRIEEKDRYLYVRCSSGFIRLLILSIALCRRIPLKPSRLYTRRECWNRYRH